MTKKSDYFRSSDWIDAFRLDSGNWLSWTGVYVLVWSYWRNWSDQRWSKKMVIQFPTDTQRRLLDKMLHYALVEMRMLTRTGRIEQAAALAEALHELPLVMHSRGFSFETFREFLVRYHSQYPYGKEGGLFDYLDMYRKVLISEEF